MLLAAPIWAADIKKDFPKVNQTGELPTCTPVATSLFPPIGGTSSDTNFSGVSGHNCSTGPGIEGTSKDGDGIVGQGGKNGVVGRTKAASHSGVFGQNTGGGFGVAGATNSNSASAGVFTNLGGGDHIRAGDPNKPVFSITNNGDIFSHGKVVDIPALLAKVNELQSRVVALESKIKSNNPSNGGRTSANPSPPAPGEQCAFSVILHNKSCLNADGTPSSILTPNMFTASGCGESIEKARIRAKFSYSQTFGCLSDGDTPDPGCCAFSEETTNGCLCH